MFQSWWGCSRSRRSRWSGLVFAIIGLIYTYWIKHVDYLAYYWTLFITPMFMFAGVFFPLERLPQWVQTIAWFMPLHHAADLMRALMTQGDPSGSARCGAWLLAVTRPADADPAADATAPPRQLGRVEPLRVFLER